MLIQYFDAVYFQALIRGYLVRKKFSQMKYIYTETVKCIEGDSAQATWRNDCKLCLPTVDRQHSDTRQRVDVLTDNLQQKNCCEDVCSSSASGQKDVNSSVESSHVETCTDDIITSDSLVANVDYESTDKLSHSKDMRSSLTQKMTDRTIKHIEIPQENVDQLETYESTQTFIDETNCNTPTQGSGLLLGQPRECRPGIQGKLPLVLWAHLPFCKAKIFLVVKGVFLNNQLPACCCTDCQSPSSACSGDGMVTTHLLCLTLQQEMSL